MKKINWVVVLMILLLIVFVSCKKAAPSEPHFDGTATPALNAGTQTITPTITATATETGTFTITTTATETGTITVTATITITSTITPEPPASTCSFGVNGAGNYYGGASGALQRMSRFSTSVPITLTKIAYYILADGPFTSGACTAAIYSNSASNQPENRIVISAVNVPMTGLGWNIVPIPSTTLTPGQYWLGVYAQMNGVYANITDNSDVLGGWYSGSGWTDPWTGGASSGSSGFSIRGICE